VGGWATLCLPVVRGRSMRGRLGWCGIRWLFWGFCSGGNLERSAAGGKVGCGNVTNLAYDQGGQELDTSACGCRASSLAGARFRPLPAPPRTLVCDPCSYSCPISALPSSIYVQIQKIVCTILLHLNRSEIIPPSKNLLRGADFSACTRYYFDRKRKLVA